MNLSKLEKETIILFNEEEETAVIGTYNEKLNNRLYDFTRKSDDCCFVRENNGYTEYQFPKSWIKINMPRQYSDEQRQKMAERAKENLKRGK